ncbi:MAG: hypothetical protein D6767_07935, partial [Candidatus Hydrogenedentota bacterium]
MKKFIPIFIITFVPKLLFSVYSVAVVSFQSLPESWLSDALTHHTKLMFIEYMNANVDTGVKENKISFYVTGTVKITKKPNSKFEWVEVTVQALHPSAKQIFYYDKFALTFTPKLFVRLSQSLWNLSKIVLSNPDNFPEFEDLDPTLPKALEKDKVFIKPLPLLRKGYSMLAPTVSPDGNYMVVQGGNEKEGKYSLFELFLTQQDSKVREINILDDYVFVGHPFLVGSDGTLLFTAIEDEILDLGFLNVDDEFSDTEDRKPDLSKAKKSDLWKTRFRRGLWTVPTKFPTPINTKYSELTPSLSPDGRYLYFASDRPGGKGGFDIYRVLWKQGSKAKIENVSIVNSKYDELFPVLHYDSNT